MGAQPPADPLGAWGLALAGPDNENDSELSGFALLEDENTIEGTVSSTFAAVTTEALIAEANSTYVNKNADQLEFILMVLIPLVVLVLLLLSVVLIAMYFKRKRSKQGELGGENLKVPIFEEDTPSVMEIEMEELDKWMNSLNRNADSEGLPTLKEETGSSHNPSDNESQN